MEEIQVNYAALAAVVVANFVLGFLWYTPLFGKAWAREMGFEATVKPKASQMARGMILMVIGNFLMVYVFAHNMAAWSFVPGVDQMSAGQNIANSAILTWLGFYLPVDIGVVAWENKSWKLFFINTGYHLAMLLVAAVILVMM